MLASPTSTARSDASNATPVQMPAPPGSLRRAMSESGWRHARAVAERALAAYGRRIEVIFCSNDAMANGAWEAIDEALVLLGKAIELDPDFASAYGAAGSLAAVLVWCYASAQIFLYGACVLYVQTRRDAPAAPQEPSP